MARPQTDSRVDGQSPQSCRMEVLRRDARPNTQPVPQVAPARSRPRRTAQSTQSTAPVPLVPPPDAPSAAPRQEDSVGHRAGPEEERSCVGGMLQLLQDVLPAEEQPTPEERAVARVAIQLRTIGDEMNAVYLQRRNDVAQWQNWRGVYRGLVAFLADTISTLYQHGLR
ncbi:bcl-2-binding component 3 [Brachyhypopomus gauderio]|uniref:bcl-2-binding component 3 n=1 Tax=Brachyhypopomus gauderio TaxID=698409 RepID=UPI004041155E